VRGPVSERARAVAVWLLLLEHERRTRLWACKITSAHRLGRRGRPDRHHARRSGGWRRCGWPDRRSGQQRVAEEDAHFFAEGLRRGGVLVIVSAKNDAETERAEEVMSAMAPPISRSACVYDIVIELPAQYGGPERRKAQQAYSGVDRRAA
jgi:hypothetical protein